MTRDEVKKLCMTIDVLFPNWKPKDLGFLVDAWFLTIGQYEYKNAERALKEYVATDTSGFAPSVGQLIQKMQGGHSLSELEAWAMVLEAIRDSNYHAQERFDELPPVVQKAVGSPEVLRAWAQEDQSARSVTQSHFLRSFRTASERMADEAICISINRRQEIEDKAV